MKIYSKLLLLYHSTLKKLPFFHRLVYLAGEGAVNLMEHWKHFYTDPGDPLYYRIELLFGLYEPGVTKVTRRIAHPSDVCLDIGANVGYYTRLLGNLVGATGKVVAFEPHPGIFSILRKNMEGHHNIHLVPKAVSNKTGALEIYESPRGSGRTSIFQENVSFPEDLVKERYLRARERKQETFKVETITVDQTLASLGITEVHLVKIDIEGAEVWALRGMRETLRRSPNMILLVEYFPEAQLSAGFSKLELINVLRQFGFNIIHIIAENGSLIPLSDLLDVNGVLRISDSVNLLCRKEGTAS